MPQLSLDVSHALGREEALARLKEQFSLAKDQYRSHLSDFREEWRDHTLSFGFSAVGMKISGTLAVTDDAVRIDAELPWAAAIFKGMIETQIREELGRVLD